MRLWVLLFSLFITPIFAWNSVGHRIIAQIAYDQLTKTARAQVDELTKVMFHSRYADDRFGRAATWPDRIKSQTSAYNSWHYIDLPVIQNNQKPPALDEKNVVWAIQHAEKVLKDPKENSTHRAKSLSFLIHFAGDITQPLHCATLVDHQFPQGDEGGNLYTIHSPIADNLHQFWDRGAGLLMSVQHHYQFHYWQIQRLAREWMQDYPAAFFGSRMQTTSVETWAQQSHHIAATFAYTVPLNGTPSSTYIQQAQSLVKEQIVLAGDRLAIILNQIYGNQS